MRERPILFSVPMVRAILDGRKTQTRRALSQANTLFNGAPWHAAAKRQEWDWQRAWIDPGPSPAGNPGPYLKLPWKSGDDPLTYEGTTHRVYSRIWIGSRLWVREAWTHDAPDLEAARASFEDMMGGAYRVYWRATEPHPEQLRWRPSIHMPRWASRLTLEVTDVRVERLQGISEADAIAEGVERDGDTGYWRDYEKPATQCCGGARTSYATLWDSINGPGAWDVNPWVAAYTFRVEAGARP